MNALKKISSLVLTVSLLSAPLAGIAAETAKPRPYTLETCPVSGEKLGEMGKPFVFTHEGREIKLCCKSCKKDFDKEPAKYIKKIDDAEKKAAKPADGAEGHNH